MAIMVAPLIMGAQLLAECEQQVGSANEFRVRFGQLGARFSPACAAYCAPRSPVTHWPRTTRLAAWLGCEGRPVCGLARVTNDNNFIVSMPSPSRNSSPLCLPTRLHLLDGRGVAMVAPQTGGY